MQRTNSKNANDTVQCNELTEGVREKTSAGVKIPRDADGKVTAWVEGMGLCPCGDGGNGGKGAESFVIKKSCFVITCIIDIFSVYYGIFM